MEPVHFHQLLLRCQALLPMASTALVAQQLRLWIVEISEQAPVVETATTDDQRDVEFAALQAIEVHGFDALSVMWERADLACSIGDADGAATWYEIIGAVIRRLRDA